jgi:hypothetical protein
MNRLTRVAVVEGPQWGSHETNVKLSQHSQSCVQDLRSRARSVNLRVDGDARCHRDVGVTQPLRDERRRHTTNVKSDPPCRASCSRIGWHTG